MAELKRAKGKQTTARQKLTVVLIHLEKEIWKDNGRAPTQQALTRQYATLGNAWEAYGTAHTLYAELLVDEEAAEEECDGYHKLYDRYNDVAGKVEELEARRGQVGGPAPTMADVMQSIAASNQMHQDRQAGFVWCPVLAEEDDCCSEVKIKTEQDIVEDQMMKQSLVKELYITAVKTEKIPEAANEVEETGSLALDESSEEEQCEVTSVSAETGKGMQLDKEEELERLLKATAEGIDDALTQVEDIEQAGIEFYEVLRELDEHEDAERSGGSKEQELGNLSIKRFKGMAMERFADAIIDFKAQVERSKAEAVETQRPDTGEGNLLEVKSDEQVGSYIIKVKQDEMKPETEVGNLLEGKSEEQEVRPNIIVQQGELGPEKEQHQRPVIMVDKALLLLKKYSSRMRVMLHQNEEKQTVNSMVEIAKLWLSKLRLKEEASKDKEIEVRTGCG